MFNDRVETITDSSCSGSVEFEGQPTEAEGCVGAIHLKKNVLNCKQF